jgi:transcriptional regulator with XRE-family HTH domain
MEESKSKDKFPKTVGQKIKVWRKKKNITQDMLAKKASIPYTTLAKIEANIIKNPSLQSIIKIVEGLNITLNDLVK